MRVPSPVTKVGTAPIVGLRSQPSVIGTNAGIRVTTPLRTPLNKPQMSTPITMKSPTIATGLKSGQMFAKTSLSTRPLTSPSLATSALKQQLSPASSLLFKAVTSSKDKEKKSYSSVGYT